MKKYKKITFDDFYNEKEVEQKILELKSHLEELKRRSGTGSASVKSFFVNWNNYTEVETLFNKIKGRFSQLKSENDKLTRPSKTYSLNEKLDSINQIIDTDISFLYTNEYNTTNNFYVYAHCDIQRKINVENKNAKDIFFASLGGTFKPFYIGKGRGTRVDNETRNGYHTLVKTQRSQGMNKIVLKAGLTEKEALMLEDKLIDIFDVIPLGGYLTNINLGNKPVDRKFIFRKELEILHK